MTTSAVSRTSRRAGLKNGDSHLATLDRPRYSCPATEPVPVFQRAVGLLRPAPVLAIAAALLFSASLAAQGPRRTGDDAEQAVARHPLLDVMDFAAESREKLKEVEDYTAVFTKTELVEGRIVKQAMDVKVRHKPFSVYFRFRSGPEAGREVIYVAGANNGNVLAHEVGIKAIAGTVQIRPNGREVMKENRYPLTRVGMANMLETAYEIWETEAQKAAPDQVEVKFFPNATLGKPPHQLACEAVRITHAKPQKELKYHMSLVYFDKETKLPVRAERYGWPRRQGEKPPLVEEYTYSNIKTNVGLTNADFDTRNRNYGFGR